MDSGWRATSIGPAWGSTYAITTSALGRRIHTCSPTSRWATEYRTPPKATVEVKPTERVSPIAAVNGTSGTGWR